MGEKVYLKQNVLAEPLFNQWYAWPYLISPATAAMYVSNLHVKIMASFVSAPHVHVAALKNPAMLGGPFMNYGPERAGDIRALLEKTKSDKSHLIELAEAIKTLDHVLSEEADGTSLEPLYQKVPDPLRGYVELVYDVNHQPSIRFIEGLLYNGPYFDESAQSVALSLTDSDSRAFVFSTPRICSDDRLMAPVPFRSQALDRLFEMKTTPAPPGQLMEMLNLANGSESLFSQFFTEEQPRRPEAYSGNGLRIRYFGHACLLLEAGGVSVLCDPVVSYECATGIPRFSYADLPERIDYILITHSHQDHCMFETLLQLRHKVQTIVVPKNNGGGLADPSLKLMLRSMGFSDVREIDEAESIAVEGGRGSITSLPFLGEHGDLNIRSKTAYHVSLGERSIICAADSNNLEPQLYERVRSLVGKIDAIFIGMECDGAPFSWLYGPLLTKPLSRKIDQSRRSDGSDYEKAIDIVDRVRPAEVYVYAMGQEPWLTYLTTVHYTEASRPIVDSNRLVQECRSRGLKAERLYGQKEITLNG
jgi:L-ascorbate metabolism protein UlaG (beta-lactamase superfamily)